MRGHAMFSAEERTLDEETLEYAWLVELTIGTLSGKLTTPQVCFVPQGMASLSFFQLYLFIQCGFFYVNLMG